MLSLQICVFIQFVSKASFTFDYPRVKLQWRNVGCIGERGLFNTSIWISINASNVTGVCYAHRQMIAYNSSLPVLDSYLQNCSNISNITFGF